MKTTLTPIVAGIATRQQDHARIPSVLLVGFLGVVAAWNAFALSAPIPMSVDVRTVTGSNSNANGQRTI